MTFSLIFNLSVSFSPQNTTPHLSSALRSACCDQPGGRSPFTHNVVTVCISLSLVTLIRTAKLCVCVCVCVFMLLLHFLLLSIFILFQSFSPKYLSPSHSLLFPSFSSHSSSPRRKKTHTIGCHGNWLPWSSKVFMWSLHVCVCVCMSTVA